MKRGPTRAWPRRIIEIASTRPDPRAADPQATQKISKEQLEAALKRTKSGMRAAQRSEPRLEDEAWRASEGNYAGPRDTGPEITIVGIHTAEEFEALDPASLPTPSATQPAPAVSPLAASIATNVAAAASRLSMHSGTRRLRITPQLAVLVGLTIFAFVTLAAVVGFFAGRVALP